jgi:hypothetical protein
MLYPALRAWETVLFEELLEGEVRELFLQVLEGVEGGRNDGAGWDRSRPAATQQRFLVLAGIAHAMYSEQTTIDR